MSSGQFETRVGDASKSSHSVGIQANVVKHDAATMYQRTYFMLLKATAAWRALDAAAQRAVFDDALMTVFNGYPDLRMTRFQIGTLHARCTDVIVWELTADAEAWQYEAAIEALHGQAFFAAPLFEVIDVIQGVEDDTDMLLPLQAFAA